MSDWWQGQKLSRNNGSTEPGSKEDSSSKAKYQSGLKRTSRRTTDDGRYGEAAVSSVNQDAMERRTARFKMENKVNKNGYGFISRGEDLRLQKSEKSRIEFFQEIQQKFTNYCVESGTANLAIDFNNFSNTKANDVPEQLDWVFMSLRKLREALLNTKNPNAFSKKVFLFSVRISSNIGHYQTYIPSINYLLGSKHLLTDSEISEISTLLILHLSHCNNENLKAFELFYKYNRKSIKLQEILKCWVNKDFVGWKKLYESEANSAKVVIMRFGLHSMVEHAIKAISASYYSIKLKDLNCLLPVSYKDLQLKHKCDWKLNGDVVKIKERAAALTTKKSA